MSVPRVLRASMLCAAALLSACGDLSQEDLLFLAVLPTEAELELRPAGAARGEASLEDAAIGGERFDEGSSTAEGQALARACEPADLRCTAQRVAARLNGLTFGLLEVIDHVTGLPPTERGLGRRVWGPRYNPESDVTTRFEATRSKDSRSFAFCVHVAAGERGEGPVGAVDCTVEEDADSGLALLVSGTLEPGTDDQVGARAGTGAMQIDLSRLPQGRGAGRRLAIEFDNTDGPSISMTLEGALAPGTNRERAPAHYAFSRARDGAGTFAFDALGNIARESTRVEQLRIGARWQPDQSGRADASVTGGDAPPGFAVTQCWAADGANVFLSRGVPPDVTEGGEEARCAYSEGTLVDVRGSRP